MQGREGRGRHAVKEAELLVGMGLSDFLKSPSPWSDIVKPPVGGFPILGSLKTQSAKRKA